MIGHPRLIVRWAGQLELLWLTSAGNGSPWCWLLGRYYCRGEWLLLITCGADDKQSRYLVRSVTFPVSCFVISQVSASQLMVWQPSLMHQVWIYATDQLTDQSYSICHYLQVSRKTERASAFFHTKNEVPFAWTNLWCIGNHFITLLCPSRAVCVETHIRTSGNYLCIFAVVVAQSISGGITMLYTYSCDISYQSTIKLAELCHSSAVRLCCCIAFLVTMHLCQWHCHLC